MMNTDLRQTLFHIEKLQNVVNVGSSSAFQILTYPGPVIGRMVSIGNADRQSPANDAIFHAAKLVQGPASWFRRILSAFRG